jgi:hypothetical protein
MTDEQIKAAISQHFIQLVAARRGFKCSKPELDEGCDLNVTKATVVSRNGKTRHIDSGQYVDLQLKCTSEARVIRIGQIIKYDLEAQRCNF